MMKKTPIKRKVPITLNRTGLKKKSGTSYIKRKAPDAEKVEAQRIQSEKDINFYNKIWASRPHKCIECGRLLGGTMNKGYMDHLVEKSSHPELRYEEENIALVCLDCHGSKSNGFPGPIHAKLIEEAKLKFL